MNATHEEWRPVVGHEGSYEVSSLGRVRSLDRVVKYRDGRERFYPGIVLRQSKAGPDGRRAVKLGFRAKTAPVHILVAQSFHGPRPDGMVACHSNGIATDNCADNLRWDTQGGNLLDKVKHGTDIHANRTHCPRGHLLAAPNLVRRYTKPEHHRECRSCNNGRAYVQNHPGADMADESDRFYERFRPKG